MMSLTSLRQTVLSAIPTARICCPVISRPLPSGAAVHEPAFPTMLLPEPIVPTANPRLLSVLCARTIRLQPSARPMLHDRSAWLQKSLPTNFLFAATPKRIPAHLKHLRVNPRLPVKSAKSCTTKTSISSPPPQFLKKARSILRICLMYPNLKRSIQP